MKRTGTRMKMLIGVAEGYASLVGFAGEVYAR